MIQLHLNEHLASSHFSDVKDLIQARIRSVLAKNGIIKNGGNVVVSPQLYAFLNSLLNDQNLEQLIKIYPSQMRGLIITFAAQYPDFTVEDSADNHILSNVFIAHAYDKFSKLNFIRNIAVDSCTYCNRAYTYALNRTNNIKPEIDHFFPKTIFPFFAISFYNLIPSCQTCNGVHVKGQKNPTLYDLVSPYELTDQEFLFTYKINSIDVINPLAKKESVSIYFSKKISGNVDVFKLSELYELHSDHALELIIKSKLKYSESYRKYLESYTELKFNSHEIDRLILGNYSQLHEIHKRPLAKLYQDLGRELGLIAKLPTDDA
jgi:hypothetical protein